jgi:hypothetical protein
MLNLDTSPLTELSSVKNGELAYTGNKLYIYNNDAWYPVGYREVKELVWEGTGCWWNATTPVGTFNIGLDTLYDDYELVVVAYDFNYTIIFRGEKSDKQSLLQDVETAKQLCQDKFNELVSACLK